MRKILALWATPRSTSTAFERVMSNRGDMDCLHEPYNEAWYFGEDRRHDRYFDDDSNLKTKKGLTFASLHAQLQAHASRRPLFIKDFAYSIIHCADDAFIDQFNHTFLIRDPEKVLTSLHARWPNVTLPEIGFEELHTLFRRVRDRLGRTPLVLDSDELLGNPERGMKIYCDAAGIPFVPEAMQWKPSVDNPTWNSDAHGFHDSLKQSSGLKPQKRSYPPLSSSADMMRLYDASMPHYEALFSERVPIVD